MVCLRWPLPERRPAPPQAARLGCSAGSGRRWRFRRVWSWRQRHSRERRSPCLHYFRYARDPAGNQNRASRATILEGNPRLPKGHTKDRLSGLRKGGLVLGSSAITSSKCQIACAGAEYRRHLPIRLAEPAWDPYSMLVSPEVQNLCARSDSDVCLTIFEPGAQANLALALKLPEDTEEFFPAWLPAAAPVTAARFRQTVTAGKPKKTRSLKPSVRLRCQVLGYRFGVGQKKTRLSCKEFAADETTCMEAKTDGCPSNGGERRGRPGVRPARYLRAADRAV